MSGARPRIASRYSRARHCDAGDERRTSHPRASPPLSRGQGHRLERLYRSAVCARDDKGWSQRLRREIRLRTRTDSCPARRGERQELSLPGSHGRGHDALGGWRAEWRAVIAERLGETGKEVLKLIAEGQRSAAIATGMGISVAT